VLVVGGGDGTLSAVAGLLRGTGVALGVLPLGTFNHFARDLGIPLDIAKAVEVLARGAPRAGGTGGVYGPGVLNNPRHRG
jgi:diacylglycerol kinase family enzyme